MPTLKFKLLFQNSFPAIHPSVFAPNSNQGYTLFNTQLILHPAKPTNTEFCVKKGLVLWLDTCYNPWRQ